MSAEPLATTPRTLARSRWARRLAWTALALVALRALLALATPLVFAVAARNAGVDLDYASSRLSLARGEFELRDARIALRGQSADAPLAHLGRLRVDLDLGALLRGDLRVAQAEVDGLEVWIAIAADGSCAWSALGAAERSAEAEPSDEEPASLALPLDFNAQLLRARVHLADASVTPPIELTLNADGRAEARAGAGNAVLWLSAREALRQARVELDFSATERALELDLAASFDALELRALQGRLAAEGLEALEPSLSGSTRARASLQLVDARAPSFAGRVLLRDLRLLSGEVDALRLDSCELVASELGEARAALRVLRIVNPALRVEQLEDGRLAFAGVTSGAASTSSVPDAASSEPSAPIALVLERFDLSGGSVELHDRRSSTAAPLQVVDANLEASALRWPTDGAQSPSHFAIRARAPDVFDALALTGLAQPGAESLTLSARLELNGASFARLAPQLAQLGLEPELRAGRARAELTARADWSDGTRLEAALERVSWSDERELFAFERLSLDAARLADQRLEVGALTLNGLRANVRRDKEGAVHALGFVLRPPSAAPTPPGPAAPNATATPSSITALTLESLSAEASSLTFVDELPESPVELALRDARLTLEQLDLGDVAAPRRAALRAFGSSPELARELRLDAQLSVSDERVDLAGSLAAREVDLRPLAAYLAPSGLEPTLAHGLAQAQFELAAQRTGGEWSASAKLRALELLDGEQRLAALESVALEGLALRPAAAGVEFQRLRIERPYVLIERDAQGRLSSCGLRSDANTAAIAPQPSQPSAADLPRAWFPLAVWGERVDVIEAQLAWRDNALAAPFELELRGSADLNPLDLGGAGTLMSGRITLAADSVCDELRVGIGASASAQRMLVLLQLDAHRLRAGPLAAYLPAGVEFTHERGSAHARLEFEGQLEDDGSVVAGVKLGPTYLLAAEGYRTLDIEQVTARARLRGAPEPMLELHELRSHVVRAIAELDAAGALTFAGLRFAPRPEGESSAQVTVNDSAPPTRAAPATTPRVSVGALELELSELKFVRPGAEPALLSLRVTRGDGPGVDSALPVWLAPFDEVAQPVRLAINGALRPACGEFELQLEATPCAESPGLALRARASELSSAGMLALAPELAAHVAPTDMERGEARLAFDAHLDVRRRQPLELDPSAPIGFEAVLSKFALRATPDGPPLAGLEALRIEGGQLQPRDGGVKIASIELERPSLRVVRDASGISALGFTLRPDDPNSAPDSHESREASDENAVQRAPTATVDAQPEVLIERIVANGLDVLFEDTSGPAPARLPLNALDAEIKRFSTLGLARGEPLAFRATLGAAEVELPPRIAADSLLEGVAAGVAELLDGEENARANEQRPLFAELNLSGKLALAPAPSGWLALNVEALELPALRGPALASGVEIGDGLADLDLRLRLAGQSGLSVDARASFAHLSLSEPADGPLARYLSLPAPLDTVLFLLKDAEGRHKFSVGFRAPPEGVSGVALARSAAGAAAEVIARAVASSPLRLLSTLTDAAGLTGGEEAPPSEARELRFESGDPTLGAEARTTLAQLAERLRGRARLGLVLEHELSRADLERAARLVNPSSGDRARLSARLREQRAELCRERDERAALARAQFALAERAEREALAAQLRELEARVGQCDEALERVLELQRPGAERRAAARARAAAVSLGAERVERARRALLALGVAPERILTRTVRAQPGAAVEGGGSVRVWVR